MPDISNARKICASQQLLSPALQTVAVKHLKRRRCFYQGYSQTNINQAAITYNCYSRVIEAMRVLRTSLSFEWRGAVV